MNQKIIDDFNKCHPIKFFTHSGGQLEYIYTGKGDKTLLIFPGAGQAAESNFAMIENLEKRFRVIALTIYDTSSINEFCQIVNDLLDREKINKVNIYGLSLGGLLAQSYLFRNKDRVESVIISHACTPESKLYKKKVIVPLRLLNIFLPLLPNVLIRKVTKISAARVQGIKKTDKFSDQTLLELRNMELGRYFGKDFLRKYMNKTLLRTWINLHFDFFNNEKFRPEDIKDWKGKILILRTDNDPLMQDEGYFVKLYPNAKVHTFKNTGHLTYYYQFTEMMKIINKFLA